MEQLTPQVMNRLVFTIFGHSLPDSQMVPMYELLLEAQKHADPMVRELGVVAMGELPVSIPKRVMSLANSLHDSSARVRRRAARTLGDFGIQAIAAVPALVTGVSDYDPSVRRDCAGTLGRLGPAAAPAATGLVNLLDEPETRTRMVAASAIKRIGRGAVPALLEGLRHTNSDVRSQCTKLLLILAPDDATVQAAIQAAAADGPRRREMNGTDPHISLAFEVA